jgi:hypothetical protein
MNWKPEFKKHFWSPNAAFFPLFYLELSIKYASIVFQYMIFLPLSKNDNILTSKVSFTPANLNF